MFTQEYAQYINKHYYYYYYYVVSARTTRMAKDEINVPIALSAFRDKGS